MPGSNNGNNSNNNAINSSTNGENTNITNSDTLSLEFLIKLIPEKFDGDRYKIRSFVKQVDSVFELATPSQQKPLLLFVKSKITGKAREQVDIHCNLTTWDEISELLLNLYQDKKSFDQLLEELNNTKQSHNENVSQYYQRLEDVSSRILASIHATEVDPTLLKGRLMMVNDMTLNRFIYHSHPQISQMLRYRDFKTINAAFSAAVAEEKALRLNSQRINSPRQTSYKYSGNKNDYRSVNFNQAQTASSKPPQATKKCNYCKKFGHTIDECRKREYNNAKRVNQRPSFSQHSANNNNSNSSQTSKPRDIHFQNANFHASSLPTEPPIEETTQEFVNFTI